MDSKVAIEQTTGILNETTNQMETRAVPYQKNELKFSLCLREFVMVLVFLH